MSSGVRLRIYQREAIDAVRDRLGRGQRRCLVVLPVGTGKTVVFGSLAREIGQRALILAHRQELLDQAVDKLRVVWPEADVGVVQGGRDGARARDVVVASVASLQNPRRRAQVGAFGLVVCDEAHHAVSKTWRDVLEAMGVFGRDGPACVGFTATPGRSDERGLGAVFGRLAYERSIPWMVERGYLSDLRALVVKTEGIDLDSIPIGPDGDFDAGRLGGVLNTANRNDLIVRTYREHAAQRKGLMFTATVQHAVDLAAAFRVSGFSAQPISGSTPERERRRLIDAFRAGRIQVLVNAAVLTEGFDDPAVDAVGLARPTASTALFIQMVGRGLRPHPRKRECLLLDFVDASRRHKLAGLPRLLGERDLEPSDVLPEDGRRTLRQLLHESRAEQLGLPLPAAAGTSVEEIGDLLAASRFQWKEVGQTKDLVLAMGSKRLVLRRAGPELYEVGLVERGRWEPLADRPLDIGFAHGVAEDYIREHGLEWVRKDAPWRNRPATDRQRDLLEQMGLPVPATRGEASAALSRAWAGGMAAGGG